MSLSIPHKDYIFILQAFDQANFISINVHKTNAFQRRVCGHDFVLLNKKPNGSFDLINDRKDIESHARVSVGQGTGRKMKMTISNKSILD